MGASGENPESCTPDSSARISRLKRLLPIVPLMVVAPCGYFIGPFLDGSHFLGFDRYIHVAGFGASVGDLLSGGSVFILPLAISFVIARRLNSRPGIWHLQFLAAWIMQFVLMVTLFPDPGTAETMGLAHRLRNEFSTDELRRCATDLRTRYQARTLMIYEETEMKIPHVVNQLNYKALMRESHGKNEVEASELPLSLRDRFLKVIVREDRVYFILDEGEGIICDDRKFVRDSNYYSMAEGVHADSSDYGLLLAP